MNVSDKILSNIFITSISQNEGYDAFISLMRKSAPLLIIPASVILYLMNRLTSLKKSDSHSSAREIKIISFSAVIIFFWIGINIFGYFWIYVIDQTYYLFINNMLSLSWVGLTISSLGFAIREPIMEVAKTFSKYTSCAHKKLKKIIHCIFNT